MKKLSGNHMNPHYLHRFYPTNTKFISIYVLRRDGVLEMIPRLREDGKRCSSSPQSNQDILNDSHRNSSRSLIHTIQRRTCLTFRSSPISHRPVGIVVVPFLQGDPHEEGEASIEHREAQGRSSRSQPSPFRVRTCPSRQQRRPPPWISGMICLPPQDR